MLEEVLSQKASLGESTPAQMTGVMLPKGGTSLHDAGLHMEDGIGCSTIRS